MMLATARELGTVYFGRPKRLCCAGIVLAGRPGRCTEDDDALSEEQQRAPIAAARL